MTEGGADEGRSEPKAQASQMEVEQFADPYTYEYLLDRINKTIQKNNTYSSKSFVIQLKTRISF